MIIQRDMPAVGELVLVRVKKVMPFGAYCELVEFNGRDSYLPIKEVASGWIKNIHEFIKEGQKTVGKVVYIDREKKAIDISLKKVSKKEEKDKINDFNLEKRSENLFMQALNAAEMKEKREETLTEIVKKYPSYNELINTVSESKNAFEGLKLNKKFEDALKEVVEKNIKPKVFSVAYIAELSVYDTKNGISIIKRVFAEIEKFGVRVSYLGAPHYKLASEDASYPKAEEKISRAREVLEKIPDSTLSVKKDTKKDKV